MFFNVRFYAEGRPLILLGFLCKIHKVCRLLQKVCSPLMNLLETEVLADKMN